MKILILGGTRFIGKHLVGELLSKNHDITIATRGIANDDFGSDVKRIKLDRYSASELKKNLCGKQFDLTYDSLAYSSNDVKNLLDVLECKRYIMTSTASVYDDLHVHINEAEFNPLRHELIWCDYNNFDYGESKRQAEAALFQEYSSFSPVAVRFPLVIGKDDYTERVEIYIKNICNNTAMNITDVNNQIAFVTVEDAAKALCMLSEVELTGSFNIASDNTFSVNDIIREAEKISGCKLNNAAGCTDMPFNGFPEFSLNTEKIKEAIDYSFADIKAYMPKLIDYYIKKATNNE